MIPALTKLMLWSRQILIKYCVSCSVVPNSLWLHGCSPPGSSVYGIFQARILEWVAISFSRRFSQPRDRTLVSYTAGRLFTNWAMREAPCLLRAYQILYTHTHTHTHMFCLIFGASLIAQSVKNLPAVQENRVLSFGWEDLLEKEMATHSSILAWKIP